jgi:hypothetical protein
MISRKGNAVIEKNYAKASITVILSSAGEGILPK